MSVTRCGYICSDKKSTYLRLLNVLKNEVYLQTELDHGTPMLHAIESTINEFSIEYFVIRIFQLEEFDHLSIMKLCQDIRDILDSHSINYQFVSNKTMLISSALIAGKIFATPKDIFLMISLTDGYFRVVEIKYSQTGFKQLAVRNIKDDENESFKYLKSKIMGSCNPVKIIGYTTSANASFKRLKKILNSKDLLIIVDADKMKKAESTFVSEMVKWLQNKSETKYYVYPTTFQAYSVMGIFGDISFPIFSGGYDTLSVECEEEVPFYKILWVTKPFQGCSLLYYDNDEAKEYQNYEAGKYCDRYSVVLKIDSHHFPSVEISPVSGYGVKRLSLVLNQRVKEKNIPVIGFFDNSSVICTAEDNRNYKFLDKWNGCNGNELFINFEKEKPQYGSDAVVFKETDMMTVVYDLIKIMSMPADKIVVDKKWKFTFTKDNKHPVLLEFDCEGEKRKAPPAFLMALLLKEHRRIIKAEIGKKPKKIIFAIVNNYGFTTVELTRVEKQLEEACKLYKIQCSFVDVM